MDKVTLQNTEKARERINWIKLDYKSTEKARKKRLPYGISYTK